MLVFAAVELITANPNSIEHGTSSDLPNRLTVPLPRISMARNEALWSWYPPSRLHFPHMSSASDLPAGWCCPSFIHSHLLFLPSSILFFIAGWIGNSKNHPINNEQQTSIRR